jgi:hypothetical protein
VWAQDLDWVEFGDIPASTRVLEIFLDRLAARTVYTADNLFDSKYEDMVSDADRRLRNELERLNRFDRPGLDGPAIALMLTSTRTRVNE